MTVPTVDTDTADPEADTGSEPERVPALSDTGKPVHRICRMLRQLRHAAQLSLTEIEAQWGISAVVLGAYERGDRIPPLHKLEHILNHFGYELQAVPCGTKPVRLSGDVVSDLRAIADQIEARESTVGSVN